MGRKKIKIRPIKDDRNRAVTFLKRKNGLFKKAFELAVLCRAEVAVIVFAGNKKLYEFASSDIKDVLYRYTQAPEAYEHRGPEDFQNKEDADSDDSDDGGADISSDYHARMMSHTPQPHGTPQFTPQMHQRRTSNESIISDRRQSLHHVGTPQLVPNRTPPMHTRHHSLHTNTPPQHFQIPLAPNQGSPQHTPAVRPGMMQPQQIQHGVPPEHMGLGIGVTPQPYGVNYDPYGHPVYLTAQENPPRRPSSTPNYQYSQEQQHPNPYQPSPPLSHQQHHQPPQPEPSPNLAPQPQVTEIKSKGRMKSIHTPVSYRASSLAAHFDTARTHYDRHPSQSQLRSHSADNSQQNTPQAQQILPQNIPLSNSPPPITTTTPGSTSNQSTGQRPTLSLHIPDPSDPNQQAEESPVSATPGTASPEISRQDTGAEPKRKSNSAPTSTSPQLQDPNEEHHRRNSQGEMFFLPPPTSASSLHPNSRLPGPGLGAFDSGASGGTPLSALPSRYAGDLLPSPSTFYPEFYGNLPSAGTSNMRSGFSGLMNGTPIVGRADEGMGFGGFGGNGGGEKRRAEELQSAANKRARG